MCLTIAACGHANDTVSDGGSLSPGGDSAVVAPAMTKAYLFDFESGIFRFARDATTGGLTLVDPTPTPVTDTDWGTTSKDGTHLYALSGIAKQILDFTIGSDGAL